MADIFNLTCPSCGGKLQVTSEIDRFACGHCGNEHIVRRSGGIVTITPLIEGLNRVQAGVDRTASELAITRLRNELIALTSNLNQKESVKFDIGLSLILLSIFPFGFAALSFILLLMGGGSIALWMLLISSPIGILLFVVSIIILKRSDTEIIILINQKQAELIQHENIVRQ
jgi:hypothetical protein